MNLLKRIVFIVMIAVTPCALAQKSATQYFEEGAMLLNGNNIHAAIAAFDEAIRMCQNTASFWERRGTAYFGIKNFYQAINDYTMAINLSPQIGFYYTERALAFFSIGNSQSTVNDLIMAANLGETAAMTIISEWTMAYAAKELIETKMKMEINQMVKNLRP